MEQIQGRDRKAMQMSDGLSQRIAIIGFGEVGGIFGQDLAAAGKDVVVYDRLFFNDQSRERLLEKAAAAKVHMAESLDEALGAADLVLSAITASSALPLAREATVFLRPRQIYVDLNSVSPERKKQIGEEVGKSGADFVEAAVMAAVKAARLKTPILLGGTRAPELAVELQALGMDTTAVSEKIGVASTIKMCRSVLMKGLAALTIESLFAARRYGAEDAVLASFEKTYPGMGWAKGLPDALTRRAVEHSRRREAEMREVVETLQAAGMNSGMSSSTADLQNWLTREMESRHMVYKDDEPFSWRAIADAIAAPLKTGGS
jgi:3-hydroxyisobutyrate dehydrogenase-like beta-hydroxyacid dehydrogenase